MTPANRLKLNFVLIAVLVFYWFLDQAIPDAVTPYDNIALTATSSSPALNPDLKQLTTDAEAVRKITQDHPGQTSFIALTTDSESQSAARLLIARASQHLDLILSEWRIDEASTLLAAAILDATERGVKVRLVIDDHAVHVSDKTLFALARHPLISVRVFQPQHRVNNYAGIRLWDFFSGLTPRRHGLAEQSIVVDDLLAIQGGAYGDGNAQGRDFLLAGLALNGMRKHFDQVWQHPLSIDIASTFPKHPTILHNLNPRDKKINFVYQAVQSYAYAQSTAHSNQTARLSANNLVDHLNNNWTNSPYLHSDAAQEQSNLRILELLQNARTSIHLQTPTPTFPDKVLHALAAARQRGVDIKLICDSMASNQSATTFARYRAQRKRLVAMGIQIREFKPEFQAKHSGLSRHTQLLLIDHNTLYTGHFTLFADAKTTTPASAFIIKDPLIIDSVAMAFKRNFTSQQVSVIQTTQTDQADQDAGFWRKMAYHGLAWWLGLREK